MAVPAEDDPAGRHRPQGQHRPRAVRAGSGREGGAGGGARGRAGRAALSTAAPSAAAALTAPRRIRARRGSLPTARRRESSGAAP